VKLTTVVLLLILAAPLGAKPKRHYYLEPHSAQVQWAKGICQTRYHATGDNAGPEGDRKLDKQMCRWAHWVANLSQDDFEKMMAKSGYAGG
jgi:hypothetical protein